jgi:MAF protein
MRKIYLATQSKARKEVFEIFGLRFKALPAKIRERTRLVGGSYSKLAKLNALNKAKAAAAKVKSGVILAADTIVVQDGVISGKPKNLDDARKMLKRLSNKPHWLYTGICAVEKGKGKDKVFLDCEKTKIYMDKLSDKEISAYFNKVNPLDKAGGFDIQGKGAFFIRRIEGCFYNVVGLPVRKLYRMLNKLDMKLLTLALTTVYCLLSAVFISGCSTEYNIVTGEEEMYYYSTDKEVAMGAAIDKQVREEYKAAEDPLMQKRVEDIGKKIASVCDRKEITYHFAVLQDDEVNAVSLPGGYVYVNSGLIEKVSSDDELAGVIAHEVGHIVARHSIKKLQAYQMYSILRLLTVATPQTAQAGAAADLAFEELLLGYGREDELLADQLGARYSKLAGYDPQGMISFLNKLQEVNRRQPLRPRSYYKTHPYIPDRIRVVKQELGQGMDFDDYINIQQETHK